MKDGLADGLARVRERAGALRGRGAGSGDRYVLLPSGEGRNRRLAELGAVAGVVVIVVAFVSAAIALRPSSSAPTGPPGPGLPAPTEFSVQQSLSPSPSGTSVTYVPPERTGSAPTVGRPLPSATLSAEPTGTPTSAAPPTRASATVPPVTKPPVVTTPPPSASPSVTPSATPSPTVDPTTDPPPPVGP